LTRTLHTILSFSPEEAEQGLGPLRVFQAFAGALQHWFRLGPTSVIIVDRPGGSKVGPVPTVALLGPDADEKYRGLRSITGDILNPSNEAEQLASFEMVRNVPGKDVVDLPSWLQHLVTVRMWWEMAFWSDYADFERAEYQANYAGLLRAARDEAGAVRIADGPDALGWNDGEAKARFIYYRDPLAFARSFMELHGLEGEASRAVAVLRGFSDRGVLDQLVHERSPALAALEAASVVTPFKRLRFTTQGGIILEEGRYGVGYDEETGESPWINTWWPLKPILLEALATSGVAKRVARALDAKK
jgi:hypothetical protein